MSAAERLQSFVGRVQAVPLAAYPRVAWQLLRRGWTAATAPAIPREFEERVLLRAFQARDREQLLADFEIRDVPRFFWQGNAAGRAALVTARSPGLAARLQQCGDDVLAHRFDLLGSGSTELGASIPWRCDFKSGHTWPCQHFTRLNLVDLDAGFDVKVPWELSRFHHAITLGQCFALTGESRYATEFMAQLQDWWVDNPCGFGPNWANAMEVAIRAVNLIWAYELMRTAPQLDHQLTLAFLKSLLQHGRFIARNLEAGWPGSNHFVADLCGLIWLGIYLRPAPEANRWLRTGLRLLARELRTQIYADGADYEASSSYHLFVTEMVLWTCAYCQLNEISMPAIVRERLAGMLTVIVGLLRPDGEMPLFGDCDSGRWLALESDTERLRTGQDARGLLAVGAVFFDRDDWLAAAAIPELKPERCETVIWAFGEQAAASIERPLQNECRSAVFPDAGWHVLRVDDGYMAVNASENGAGGWGLHAHNDALSFELVAEQRAFIVDPGSYAYTGDYRARNVFRATAAHNTVQVDAHEMNRIPERDLFRLSDDIRVRVHQWGSDNTRSWLDAKYVSRAAGREMLYHRRRFEFFREGGYWLLTDYAGYADAGKPSELRAYFHFAALPVELDGLTARTVCADGANLAVFPLSAGTRAVATAELQQGWISPRYGVRERAPVLQYRFSQRESTAIKTVLLLYESEEEFESRRRALQGASH